MYNIEKCDRYFNRFYVNIKVTYILKFEDK